VPRFISSTSFFDAPLPVREKNRMHSLEQLVLQAQTDFSAADDAAALENAKAKYLGKTRRKNARCRAP
jgi:hypothetical protein